jgi:hypothetical protein
MVVLAFTDLAMTSAIDLSNCIEEATVPAFCKQGPPRREVTGKSITCSSVIIAKLGGIAPWVTSSSRASVSVEPMLFGEVP